jgi:hypothetical protein
MVAIGTSTPPSMTGPCGSDGCPHPAAPANTQTNRKLIQERERVALQGRHAFIITLVVAPYMPALIYENKAESVHNIVYGRIFHLHAIADMKAKPLNDRLSYGSGIPGEKEPPLVIGTMPLGVLVQPFRRIRLWIDSERDEAQGIRFGQSVAGLFHSPSQRRTSRGAAGEEKVSNPHFAF